MVTELDINTVPWPHLVIDNFYHPDLFEEMRKEVTKHYESLPKNVTTPDSNRTQGEGYEHVIKLINAPLKDLDNGHIINERYNNPSLFNSIKRCLDSRPIDESWIEMFQEHREYNELLFTSELCTLRDEMYSSIHDENPKKILSCVMYIIPETAYHGTTLYKKNSDGKVTYKKRLEWKPNRMFIFAGKTGVTWHSYDCPNGSYRVTLTQFLADLKLRAPKINHF